jgi:hypothetical protein
MEAGTMELLVESRIWSDAEILEFGSPAKKRDTSVGV